MISLENNHIDFSIIICTYNPDERILKRCLQALYILNRDDIKTEVILVDNNSKIPVNSLPYVKEYLDKIQGIRAIMVAEQGVSHARIAAIDESQGKYIIYFDYDNEPAPDYLQQLKKLHVQYPEVAAWGPGNVQVDFIDGIESNIEPYARIAFQQRQDTEINYANLHEWQYCYPFGTGLCTYTFLLKEYILLAKQGQFTLSGRKANQLSSGEDTQMVLFCISKGYYAGVAPALKLTHIIPGKRANKKYLQRLVYGTTVCYETCLLQVFPERKKDLVQKMIPAGKFVRQTIKKLINSRLSANTHKLFELINFIGLQAGIYTALNKPLPRAIKSIIRYLDIE